MLLALLITLHQIVDPLDQRIIASQGNGITGALRLCRAASVCNCNTARRNTTALHRGDNESPDHCDYDYMRHCITA